LLFLLAFNQCQAKGRRLWLKYLKSFPLKGTSEEDSKVLAEVLAQNIERQG